MGTSTVLLYGPTGSGKSTQLGLLAEEVFVSTGLKTRVYTADFGGTDTIAPYIDLGVIELIELGSSDPWIFVNKAVRGFVRDNNGKWVLDKTRNAGIGMFCFESAHGIANLLKLDMERKAGTGISVGGDTNTSFQIQGDGETIKIGSSKGYQKYAIPQGQILEAIYESFKLPCQYVVWTAGVSKDEDDVTTSKIVGPDVIGRALTGILPKDFNYCFRLGVVPAQGAKQEEHILYLGTHTDPQAGGATALGNIRRPLDAKALIELTIRPANLVKALKVVKEDAKSQALEAIRQRLEKQKKP